jgi:hypothetical protein
MFKVLSEFTNNKEDNRFFYPREKYRGNLTSLDEKYYANNKNLTHILRREIVLNNNAFNNTIVKDFDFNNVKPQRAGVIMYTIMDNEIYFGMGLDTKTHDITDFGGGVSYKKDLNAIVGALREFNEETLSIFNKIKITDIENSQVIYDNNNLIVFVNILLKPSDICERFNEKFDEMININKYWKNQPEVCGIIWLSLEQLNYCLNTNGIMFTRVKKFLSKITDIKELICKSM